MLLNALCSRHGFRKVPEVRHCFGAQQHEIAHYFASRLWPLRENLNEEIALPPQNKLFKALTNLIVRKKLNLRESNWHLSAYNSINSIYKDTNTHIAHKGFFFLCQAF